MQQIHILRKLSTRSDGIRKDFRHTLRTISFHRTLTNYFDVLNRSGLFVSRLEEPRLTKEASQKHPYLRDDLTRPQSVIAESAKIAKGCTRIDT